MLPTDTHPLSRLLAKKKSIFFISSTLSRLTWAGMVVYLASSLGADEYGNFSFWSIIAASLSGVAFGGLANAFAYEQSRKILDSEYTTNPLVYGLYTSLSFFLFFAVAAVVLYGSSPELAVRGGGLVGGLAASLVLSTLAISQLCALGHFLTASLCAALGPACFISLSLLHSDGTAELITLYSIFGNVISFTPALLVAGRPTNFRVGCFVQFREFFLLHVRSLAVGLANLPLQGALLILAATLMASQGAVVFAKYGLANQLFGVLLFIPSALAPVFLAQLPQWERTDSSSRHVLIWSVLLFLSALLPTIPMLVAVLLQPSWIDPIFLSAAGTGFIATFAAAFVAARSPFAWLNQAGRNIVAEWATSGVTCATIFVAVAFVGVGSAEMTMTIRLSSVALALLASIALHLRHKKMLR